MDRALRSPRVRGIVRTTMATGAVLTRHGVDRIARAVVSGRRGRDTQVDGIADWVASRMASKLAAAGFADRVPPRTPRGACPIERSAMLTLYARVGKLLASAVAVADEHERAHTR